MASPIGHGVIGAAIARRFGVRSRLGLAAAAIAASLPDGDILVGALFHSDAWTLHRQGTHTLRFAVTAGAIAGAAGLVRRDGAAGERDIVLDALMGAVIVGSHVPLDNVPLPRLPLGPRFLRMQLADWLIDAVIWSAVAWAIWPRARRSPTTRKTAPRSSLRSGASRPCPGRTTGG